GLLLPGLGIESCARKKREWVVRVGTTVPDAGDARPHHSYYPLARIRRRLNVADIFPNDITDLRELHLQALDSSDRYTRGSVGLFVSPLIADSELSRQMAERLRQVLDRFLPANVRAVVIFAPSADEEKVYSSGRAIQEIYSDKYPFIEYMLA